MALLIFWLVLASRPEIRGRFVAPDAPWSTFGAFWSGDLLLLFPTSIAAAWALARHHSSALLLLSLHTGAALYACFYAFAFALMQPERWLGAALMAPMFIVPPLLTWRAWSQDREKPADGVRREGVQ